MSPLLPATSFSPSSGDAITTAARPVSVEMVVLRPVHDTVELAPPRTASHGASTLSPLTESSASLQDPTATIARGDAVLTRTSASKSRRALMRRKGTLPKSGMGGHHAPPNSPMTPSAHRDLGPNGELENPRLTEMLA